MKRLEDFTEEDHAKLKASGMMWEIYPDATGNYKLDNRPSEKTIVINHAGCLEVVVWRNTDGGYSISQEDMEDIVERVGYFDVMVLAHITQRLQEANDE